MQHQPNLLPYHGVAQYYGSFLAADDADYYYKTLHDTIEWQRDRVKIFGREIITQREVAWYGNAGLNYTYSGNTKTTLPWTKELGELKKMITASLGVDFNSCLLNLYHSGGEGMGWHSDDEKELGRQPVIASVSLGAERRFVFKHKQTGEKIEIVLDHGSLLIMSDVTQSYWLHSLPKMLKVNEARINITFRNIT